VDRQTHNKSGGNQNMNFYATVRLSTKLYMARKEMSSARLGKELGVTSVTIGSFLFRKNPSRLTKKVMEKLILILQENEILKENLTKEGVNYMILEMEYLKKAYMKKKHIGRTLKVFSDAELEA